MTKFKMKRPASPRLPRLGGSSYTPPPSGGDDGDDKPKGSIWAGFFWTALFMTAGFLFGIQFDRYGLGFSIGIFVSFLMAQARHKWRGVVGFLLALMILGSGIFVLIVMRDNHNAERRAYLRYHP